MSENSRVQARSRGLSVGGAEKVRIVRTCRGRATSWGIYDYAKSAPSIRTHYMWNIYGEP